MPLFIAGLPTVDFYTFYETVPDSIAGHLRRFSALHFSDWYFNRAVIQVRHAAAQEGETRSDGKTFARGSEYRGKAALRFLVQWQKIAEREGVRDFGSRGLLPANPSIDHELLLPLVNVPDLSKIVRITSDLAPYMAASWNAFVELSRVEGKSQALDLLVHMDENAYVVPRVKRAIRHNVSALFQ